jgi:cell wall-associated NlpC family hydrolase
MSRLGDKVDRPSLAPGDLVFYNTRRRLFSHVGVYIGEGRFIHAPSKGRAVEIVDMSDRYWTPRFNGARRLLPAFVGPPEPESPNKNAASN